MSLRQMLGALVVIAIGTKFGSPVNAQQLYKDNAGRQYFVDPRTGQTKWYSDTSRVEQFPSDAVMEKTPMNPATQSGSITPNSRCLDPGLYSGRVSSWTTDIIITSVGADCSLEGQVVSHPTPNEVLFRGRVARPSPFKTYVGENGLPEIFFERTQNRYSNFRRCGQNLCATFDSGQRVPGYGQNYNGNKIEVELSRR